jgi:hypothetical protein
VWRNNKKRPSRGLPRDPWEMGLGGGILVPLEQGSAGVGFLALTPYFISKGLSKGFVRVALTSLHPCNYPV